MDDAVNEIETLTTDVPERLLWENIEVFVLIVAVAIALVLNSLGLVQTISRNRHSSSRNNFLNGNPTLNSFSVFKLNLCVSDFLILLIYALGKILWLITFEWCFGNIGCKFYKFMSSFSFYANSNIIVAIALDRLKCVYSTRIQGPNSIGRVRIMVAICWVLAFICSLPQLYLWKTIKITNSNWSQCVSVFVAKTFSSNSSYVKETLKKHAAFYEIAHQTTVFWLPLVIILISYLCIVLKLLSFNFNYKNSGIRKRSDEEKSYMSAGDFNTNSDTWMSFLTFNSNLRNHNMVQRPPLTTRAASDVSNGKTNHRTSGSLTWRKQLGSKVFRSACLIVLTHIVLWLPYNFISATRFFNEQFYHNAMENGGNVLEDLIIINSLLNPLIYAEKKGERPVRRYTR